MTLSAIVGALSLAVWIYLLGARGGFWRAAQRDVPQAAKRAAAQPWPHVVAVIPARNEAEVVADSIASLCRQDYTGTFTVVLIDDQSEDGTATVARKAADACGAAQRLTVIAGSAPPADWTGKLWALEQGVRHTQRLLPPPDFVLLTDADIVYADDALRELVARAQAGGFALTSLMVKLRCESVAERALIPAFIFFFQMLYPFAWVNRPAHRTAAAAGGCMLVQRAVLHASGGLDAIRAELIDDCALARQIKQRGPIWLGLTDAVRSIRAYPHVDDIRRMVARSAYTQLRCSPMLLLGTVAAMVVTYWAPPLLAVFASGWPRVFGTAAWVAMAAALQPILRFYRVSPWWGALLPGMAAVYLWFTVDSAFQYWRGRGGMWKGRAQALRSQSR